MGGRRTYNISGHQSATAESLAYACRSSGRPVRCAFLTPTSTQRKRTVPLAPPLLDTTIAHTAPSRRGKVRDLYDAGDALVIVATDRISAFDYVLGSGIPDKGRILTQLSRFW